jgi:hypothetical protein
MTNISVSLVYIYMVHLKSVVCNKQKIQSYKNDAATQGTGGNKPPEYPIIEDVFSRLLVHLHVSPGRFFPCTGKSTIL